MGIKNQTSKKDSTLTSHIRAIESYLTEYCGIKSNQTAELFIDIYSDQLLDQCDPGIKSMPAAFIANENDDTAFIGVHISEPLWIELSTPANLKDLLSHRNGLNAFMILVEEVSHFHHYVISAERNARISRFDLELQAELEKVIVCSLALIDNFGKSYIHELIQILFNESLIAGSMTDYALASKLAEKFWKENFKKFGPNILFETRIREFIRKAGRSRGKEKIWLLENSILAA